ncbi:MAG: VOC family protein [Alphaproteobacteria bacterium]|nr:VOC family protein [Alphaproteobacteria bacterium]
MSKISPCLWFASEAEEAARFYVTLLPDSRIEKVQKNVGDSPGGKDGAVLAVDFTLAGQQFMAINGGQDFPFSYAVSFTIYCDTQAEIDRLSGALISSGGVQEACGWVKDRYGLSWQITPRILPKLLADPDRGRAGRAMQAMLTMEKLDIAALEAAADGKS